MLGIGQFDFLTFCCPCYLEQKNSQPDHPMPAQATLNTQEDRENHEKHSWLHRLLRGSLSHCCLPLYQHLCYNRPWWTLGNLVLCPLRPEEELFFSDLADKGQRLVLKRSFKDKHKPPFPERPVVQPFSGYVGRCVCVYTVGLGADSAASSGFTTWGSKWGPGVLGKLDGSPGEGTHYQAWQPEFDSQHSQGERSEPTFTISRRCTYTRMHTQAR